MLVQMGAVRLRTELDRVPLWTGNHVSIKQLAEYMARYLYLPRLRDEQILIAAIQEGIANLAWQSETFAYAEGWDEKRSRYQVLCAGEVGRVLVDDRSLLVKSDVANAQIQQDQESAAANDGSGSPSLLSTGVSSTGSTGSGAGNKSLVSGNPRNHLLLAVDRDLILRLRSHGKLIGRWQQLPVHGWYIYFLRSIMAADTAKLGFGKKVQKYFSIDNPYRRIARFYPALLTVAMLLPVAIMLGIPLSGWLRAASIRRVGRGDCRGRPSLSPGVGSRKQDAGETLPELAARFAD
jgi:hypothetical protein